MKTLVAQINKLLMHFGCQSCLGMKLQLAVGLMELELGISLQPLQESHKKSLAWVTRGWLKLLCEKVDIFDITAVFNNVPLKMPRDGDEWLMLEFLHIGYGKQDLLRLN